jgi:hypothetical protein
LDNFISGVNNWGDAVKYEVEHIILCAVSNTTSTVGSRIVYCARWAEVDTDSFGMVEPESEFTLSTSAHVAVATVLSTSGTISINEMMIIVAFTVEFDVLIRIGDYDLVALTSSTSWVWIEIVIITVLTVSESFVVALDVFEVVFAHNT